MKRKRIRHADELHKLQRHAGYIDQPRENDSRPNDATVNKAANVSSGRTTRSGHDDDLLNEIPDSAALPLGRPEGSNLSHEQQYLMELVTNAIENGALDHLSEMQRACFTEVMISGETYDVVAHRYRISRGTVQNHIKRAAARIRKEIGPIDD